MRTPGLVRPAERAPRREEVLFPAVAGSLVGSAAADALGWITEFVRGAEHLRALYKTDRVTQYRGWQKTTGGRFNAYVDYINKGEYSDDTQLTLAIARSLEADGSIDIEHFTKLELPLWLDYARGAGSTITGGARAIQRKGAAWNRNFFAYRQRGHELSYRNAGANGAAMRVSPISLANVDDQQRMIDGIWRTSIVTHGHPRAILGALVYGEAVRTLAREATSEPDEHIDLTRHLTAYVTNLRIPHDPGITEWLELWDKGQETTFERLWVATQHEIVGGISSVVQADSESDINPLMKRLGCFDPATKGSGTGTFLAALLIYRLLGTDFRQAVETAINQLGADTDTIGGFVGAMCGARLGFEALPNDWARELQDYDYFMRVATELARVSARTGIGGTALLPTKTGELTDLPNVVDMLRKHEINRDERVYHPLFGRGWVESVEPQNLRRKDGAQVICARVQFYMGQSCKFRYMSIPHKSRTSKTPNKRRGKEAGGSGMVQRELF